jgi:hypothetical protein
VASTSHIDSTFPWKQNKNVNSRHVRFQNQPAVGCGISPMTSEIQTAIIGGLCTALSPIIVTLINVKFGNQSSAQATPAQSSAIESTAVIPDGHLRSAKRGTRGVIVAIFGGVFSLIVFAIVFGLVQKAHAAELAAKDSAEKSQRELKAQQGRPFELTLNANNSHTAVSRGDMIRCFVATDGVEEPFIMLKDVTPHNPTFPCLYNLQAERKTDNGRHGVLITAGFMGNVVGISGFAVVARVVQSDHSLSSILVPEPWEVH